MATIHEIAFRLEMRARRRRQAFFVVVNPDPASVKGRNTIPDWYVREMANVYRQADGDHRGVHPQGVAG